MESCLIDLYPDCGQVHVALFQNVTNVAELRARLDEKDTSLACALVDASLVMNLFHILLVVNQTFHDELHNHLKTLAIHSEIVYNFSSTRDMAQSLRRFGIGNDTTNIIMIKVGCTPSEAEAFIQSNIQGELLPLDKLETVRDLGRIQKYYETGNQGQDADKTMSLVAGALALKKFKK